MQPISRPPQPQRKPARFGSSGSGSGGVGDVTGLADALFRSFQSSRGKEMIVEDVVGFGVLRTGMDLRRNKMYGDDSWNVPAAAERFFREITSILTDSVLGGVVAWSMGKAIFDRKNKAFSNEFIQYPSLELFQDIVNSPAMKDAAKPEDAKNAFIKELSGRLGKDGIAQKELKNAWEHTLGTDKRNKFQKGTSWFRANPNSKHFNEKAADLIKKLDSTATNFDWKVRFQNGKKETFALNELLDDVSRFSKSMNKAWGAKAANSPGWQDMAKNAIARTLRAKNWAIPVGLAAGMGATFAMPFLSNFMTKKVFGIDYFPGETGLRKNQPGQPQTDKSNKSLMERYFPYVTQRTKDGNLFPLATALIPLIAAVGLFNTNTLRFGIPKTKNAFRKLFDFTKSAPFTSQQQMASMFALLITSRLLCSRSDNEYKERMLDSFAGWMAWILGTPALKWAASKLSGQQELFKAGGGLKSREAVQHFAPKALKANIWIGIGSTLATMGILGIGAPLLGIKMTQWNEQRKQQKQGQPPPVQPTPMPAIQSPPFQPFQPLPLQPFQPLMAQAQPNRFVPPTR